MGKFHLCLLIIKMVRMFNLPKETKYLDKSLECVVLDRSSPRTGALLCISEAKINLQIRSNMLSS